MRIRTLLAAVATTLALAGFAFAGDTVKVAQGELHGATAGQGAFGDAKSIDEGVSERRQAKALAKEL